MGGAEEVGQPGGGHEAGGEGLEREEDTKPEEHGAGSRGEGGEEALALALWW